MLRMRTLIFLDAKFNLYKYAFNQLKGPCISFLKKQLLLPMDEN